jgi:hypothetical protein
MPRTIRLATVALLVVTGCERPQLYVDPPEIVVLDGVRTHVHVEAVLGCADVEAPVLEPMGATTTPFALEVYPVPVSGEGGDYFIGNPGKDHDSFLPADPTPEPVPEPKPVTICSSNCDASERDRDTRAFDLLLLPPAGAGPGEHRFRVRARGCGTEASSELTVKVVGAIDLGGFCGITTGATCGSDSACARAGCGELCAGLAFDVSATGEPTSTPATTAAHCFQSACTDPVPSGATCGCVMGACAWRLP